MFQGCSKGWNILFHRETFRYSQILKRLPPELLSCKCADL